METEDSTLAQIVEAVLSSPKGRGISEDFVREVGRKELAKRRNLREAIKATKSKLHQVAGSNLGPNMRYGAWLEELRTAHKSGDPDTFLQTCMKVAAHHASTRERLRILGQFYATILADLPPIHRDPFDRLLICQAIQHGLTIATADPAFTAYPVLLLGTP